MWQKIKNIKFVNIVWFLFYVLIFLLLLRGGLSYLDPDFGWHLKAGEEAWINKTAPYQNYYNFTYTGTWVNHEWLSDLLLYLAYENLGYDFLVIFFALIITLTLVLLNIFVFRNLLSKPGFGLIIIFQLLGVLAAMPHFGIRIQEIALLFVFLLLLILENYNKYRNWPVLLWLPVLFILWANLHASFLLGLVLMFAWPAFKLLEKILAIILNKSKSLPWLDLSKQITWPQLKLFSLFSFIALLATLFNPYGFKLFSFLGGYQNKAYLSLIQEWLPQHSFPLYYLQLIYLSLGLVALLLYIYKRYRLKVGLDLWTVFLNITFLFLSWQSRRHFPLFLVVSFILIVETYSDFFSDLKIIYVSWLKKITIFCFLLVISSQLILIRFIENPFASFCQTYPCSAKNFLQENPEYLNYDIFNNYTWGGFLIWTMPEKKIFIDGRLPQVEFADKTFVEEYYEFFKKETDYQQKLEQYNIKLVLINSQDKVINLKKWEKIFFNIDDEDVKISNYLRDYLAASENWQLIYQDSVAQIYFTND